MPSIWAVLLTLLLAFVFKRASDAWKVVQTLNLPYRIVLFGPMNMLMNHFLPRIPGISLGGMWPFEDKHTAYQKSGLDIQLTVSFWPKLVIAFQIVDPAIVKEISAARTRFVKPVEDYGALSIFGTNVITAEGAEWKKHRKVCAPAFSEPNNRLVWDETVRICEELYNEVWQGQERIEYDHVVSGFSLPIALLVLSAASFGRRVTWKDDELAGAGKRYSFKEALHITSQNIPLKTALPRWAFNLTEGLRGIQQAFDDLSTYMNEMIQERRASQGEVERHDLFSNLLASCDEEGRDTFSEKDLMGSLLSLNRTRGLTRVFHSIALDYEAKASRGQTTAHALAFTLGLLALYPDEQEKLYKHIISVVPPGKTPTYEDMAFLPRVLASLISQNTVPRTRISPQQTLQASRSLYFIPKGSPVIFPLAGVHYNERYWDDPYEFLPDRFLGDWPRNAFVTFSSGPRACLGRRFFETEGVAILTTLLPKYKVSITEEPQFAHETFEDRKERVLKAKAFVTSAPVRLPITFTRRDVNVTA
ncbi:hypothetical protein NMY22_g15567 [Coprinellus aureogranulatus]|nr:hypothetical protein NMY22_g15567 [Coprinellus aureogranulatus]